MRTLVSAVTIALAACAANPAGEDKPTIEKFAEDLSGRELRLQFAPASDASANAAVLSSARDPVFGYAGLKQALAPAFALCEADAGMLQVAERRSFSKEGPQLPTRLQCRLNGASLWQLGLHYTEKTIAEEKHKRSIHLMPQARVLTQAENERAIPNQTVPAKVARRSPVSAKQTSESAEKPPAEQKKPPKSEALKAFRNNLKAGDRVQWKTSTMPARSAGIVLRLDGDLALVQFDNDAFAGKSVRYINRSQLEPFNSSAVRRTSHGK